MIFLFLHHPVHHTVDGPAFYHQLIGDKHPIILLVLGREFSGMIHNHY